MFILIKLCMTFPLKDICVLFVNKELKNVNDTMILKYLHGLTAFHIYFTVLFD